MTVSPGASVAPSELAAPAVVPTEPYEAFADGRLWQRARKLHLFLVAMAATHVLAVIFDPDGFDRFQFGLIALTLVLYSLGLLWHHRVTRRVREKPVLRIDTSGIGVHAPEEQTIRWVAWHEIDGIAWHGLDEIGIRLRPRPKDDVAEVVSIPTGQLPEEAADRVLAAIGAHCGA